MRLKKQALFLLGALAFSAGALAQKGAITPDELFTMAMTQNNGSGEKLIQGGFADEYKRVTRSQGPTYGTADKIGKTKDGCDILTLKVRQTEIPTKDGKTIGDYITVTRMAICSNGAEPRFDKSAEVINCIIAGQSCMPKNQ